MVRHCVYDLKYIRSWSQTCCGNSTALQKLDPHNIREQKIHFFNSFDQPTLNLEVNIEKASKHLDKPSFRLKKKDINILEHNKFCF